MNLLQTIRTRAARNPRRIVFPESDDPRVLAAAAGLTSAGIASPILVGDPELLRAAAGDEGLDLSGVSFENPKTSERRGVLLSAVNDALRGKGVGATEAAGLLRQPLYFAAAMVRAGIAEGTVAGAVHSTSDTLRAALRIIRPAPDAGIVSSFFLMGLREPTPAGDDVLAFADCGLVPDPDVDALVEIGRGTAEQFSMLLDREPRVALLSFSTKGSADSESVRKMRRVAEILGRETDLAVDGELQLDAALVPDVARRKVGSSPVAGRANVLIFPDLDAGNIAYKLVERLAGAQAIGPLIRGLARPANDLSRGCSVDDIVTAAAVTSLQAV